MADTTCLLKYFEPYASSSARALELSNRTSDRAFVGAITLLFALSAGLTIAWCGSMSAMGGMQMPGDWTMSMMWMRMPGQTRAGTMVSFVGMWTVMMIAMMLPSLTPMLWRYRKTVGTVDELRIAGLTSLVGLGYFVVWTLFGLAIFPAGVLAASLEMEQPAVAAHVPIATGITVVLAGILQFTNWKKRHLACCRLMPGSESVSAPWETGLRLGWHCALSCANLTATLLAFGVMNLRGMAVVTAAITAERLLPAGEYTRRVVGVIGLMAGLFLIVKAMRLQ